MKTYYDEEEDVLYIGRHGIEEEFEEVAPGVSVELDSKGHVIGVEILNASVALRKIVEPLRRRLQQAA